MKMWKVLFMLSSGSTSFDVVKAPNIQSALIQSGSNFSLPVYSKDEIEKIIITQIKNSKEV